MTWVPCTVSAIIVLDRLRTPSGSAIALIRCASERNRKCIDITPACGDSVAALAEDEDAEFDVARFHELQDLRLLPELRARILVDQHRALAQFLELVGEDIADNAVAGRLRLIIGEAIMLDVLCAGTEREVMTTAAATPRMNDFAWIPMIVSPCCLIFLDHPIGATGLSINSIGNYPSDTAASIGLHAQ